MNLHEIIIYTSSNDVLETYPHKNIQTYPTQIFFMHIKSQVAFIYVYEIENRMDKRPLWFTIKMISTSLWIYSNIFYVLCFFFQWRDHWMQAIYYPNQPLSVQKGQNVKIISSHDEYSLWFNVESNNRYWYKVKSEFRNQNLTPVPNFTVRGEVWTTEFNYYRNSNNSNTGPACTCGVHVVYSRSQIGMLNDPQRRTLYHRLLKQVADFYQATALSAESLDHSPLHLQFTTDSRQSL
jgi:hypothetical protein